MERDLLAFSQCGRHFVHCGPDGKLKLWDTPTGVLKQEFVPNLHLNSPCSSLIWVSANSTLLPWKSRKRKLEGKPVKLLAIGTAGGQIALFSLAEGKVLSTLKGGPSSAISSISWTDKAGLFSSSDNVVVHWDVSNKTIKSKWTCGKGKLTSLLVFPSGEICVTACFSLKIWDIKSHNLLQTLTGHSTEVTNLVCINQQYFLSAASNDRHISAWMIGGDSDEPVGKFALSNTINNTGLSVYENEGQIQLAAVTKNGLIEVFRHRLNGKCGDPVKCSFNVEIHPKTSCGYSLSVLPIVANSFDSFSLWIAYGNLPFLQFDCVDVASISVKHLRLIREISKPLVNNEKVGESLNENVEYVNTNAAIKRKADNKKVDVPMEERLGNLSIDRADVGSASKPSPHNMAQLLLQGLESKDKAILESVLFRRDPLIINETVSRLPLHALGPLVHELTSLLQRKTFTSAIAAVWLKTVVSIHAGHLLADVQTCNKLTRLHSIMETRLLVLPPLTSLSGRLDLLLQQLEGPSQQNISNAEALLVYQDEAESSDEASSFFGEVEGSESEDRWEELSDQEVEDTEDANMSS